MKAGRLLALCLFLCLPWLLVQPSHVSAKSVKIRFGTLPVLQVLPLFVAQEKGLFAKAGLDVELVSFNTAADKDMALSAGTLDGAFADLVTPLVLKANGRELRFVATNYRTRDDRRMFAVLGKPGGPYKSVRDLAGVPVAISSNSIINYVTERLLTAGGVPKNAMQTVESKNIGLRFQMLISGRVEAATLPEPLVTAATAKGAVLLADDKGVAESQTVLVFSAAFIKNHEEAVRGFLDAVGEAGRIIASGPESVRPVMVKHVRLPPPMKASYPVPRFPRPSPPDKASVAAVAQWLKDRGVVDRVIPYEEVVDERFLQ